MTASQQQEIKRAEKRLKKKENLACIYDPECRNPCLVRQELAKEQTDQLNQIKVFSSRNEIVAGMREAMQALTDAFQSSGENLARFCEHCPFIRTFYNINDEHEFNKRHPNIKKKHKEPADKHKDVV